MDRYIRKPSVNCCKYCNSTNIVKYGTFQGMQRYFCKDCCRKFADNDAIPKMKTPIWIISLAMDCYYDGMSLGTIQKEINQRHGAYYAQSSIYNWIIRFSAEAIRQSETFHPEVNDTWLLCSTPIITGKRRFWFYDIFDIASQFLLASLLSETGTAQEVIGLVNSTYLKIRKTPHHPVTVLVSGAFNDNKTKQLKQSNHFILAKAVGYRTGEFDALLKRRNSVVHSFNSISKAQILTGSWSVYYNFISVNDSSRHIPPAQKVGKPPFRNWLDIISQSFIQKRMVTE